MEFTGDIKIVQPEFNQKPDLNCSKFLINSEFPLSEKDIEEKMGKSCNRTTIYRNLSTLVMKGLVQRISL